MDLYITNARSLEAISREIGEDGKLTARAKDARRSLGLCLRYNHEGHIAVFCPLGKRVQTMLFAPPFFKEEYHQEAKE